MVLKFQEVKFSLEINFNIKLMNIKILKQNGTKISKMQILSEVKMYLNFI